MIEVIDYGGGNLGSMRRCLERLDIAYRLVGGDEQPTLSGDHPLLFPGVGAFGPAMTTLNQRGLTDRIRGMVKEGVPYLGVCIGLQVLFERSEEAPSVKGLGLLPGVIGKFTEGKVPQIGWNKLIAAQPKTPEGHVYFVNSYYPQPESHELVLYEADYHTRFCAAARYGAVTAFQFHPEKSGEFGHQLIADWVKRYV
jgi:imidazole glycerol phosphate synthase glutamine amidotransferase subunit